MTQPGLYPEQMTFTGGRESTERTSIERDTMRHAMDAGVEGITEEVRNLAFSSFESIFKPVLPS